MFDFFLLLAVFTKAYTEYQWVDPNFQSGIVFLSVTIIKSEAVHFNNGFKYWILFHKHFVGNKHIVI